MRDVAQLMQAFHVVKVALVEVGSRHSLHIGITRRASYFLDVVHKSTRRSHVIHAVDVADVDSHAECLGGHDKTLFAALEVLHNLCLLLTVLLAVVRRHQVPVLRADPRLDAHVDASGKGIVEQRLVSVEVVLDAGRNHLLFGLVVGLAFFDSHLPDVEAYIAPFYRAHIKHARFHLQRAYGFEHHVVVALRVPDCRGGKCKEREGVA